MKTISSSLAEVSLLPVTPSGVEGQSLVDIITTPAPNPHVVIAGQPSTLPADLAQYLSPADIQQAILTAYNTAFTAARHREYIEKLRQPAWPTFETIEEYDQYMQQKITALAQEQSWPRPYDFTLPHLQQLYHELIAYFGGFHDQLTLFSPAKKGICIVGPMGVGKTFLLRAFQANPWQSFSYIRAKELAALALRDQELYQETITSWAPSRDVNRTFGQRLLGIMIDDIGTEETVKSYGTPFNTVQDIIEARYDTLRRATTPHLFITTNLTQAELIDKYGPRAFDRLREMMNVYIIPGTVKSLRSN